uniref:Uncharacterized protein n=1 Tax=Arundo donax TaxID=35708 RepID=A0A0A9C5J0_ARUDO
MLLGFKSRWIICNPQCLCR